MSGAVDEQIFWVFGRRAQTDPYEHVGTVKAATEAIAYVYAHMNYDERPWLDLCVAPRGSFYGAPGSGNGPANVDRADR